MIINHSRRFIFIHIPRTGGTTITNILSRYTTYCDIELGSTQFGEAIQNAYAKRFGIRKHSPAREVKKIMGEILWGQYFSFAFVRNPFTRALSIFNFLRKWQGYNEDFRKKMLSFKDFEEFVLSELWDETNGPDEIFRPQIYWLSSVPGKNDIIVDFVGRLENFEEDLMKILNVIDPVKSFLEKLQIPQLNKSTEKGKQLNLSDEAVERIIKKYHLDFETFRYPIEIPIAD